MESENTQKTVTETIEEKFKSLDFTNISGNAHYASRDEADLASRTASIETFLASDVLAEPDIFPTRHDKSLIEKTAEQYEVMLDVLFSQPHRSQEDEILIDKIINKTGELFRYEELMLAMGAAACQDGERHRTIAADLSIEQLGGINKEAFSRLTNELLDVAETSESSYARELSNLITRPETYDSSVDNVELEPETREVIGQDLTVLFPGLRELLNNDQPGNISPEDAIPIFKHLLALADLDDWDVQLDNSKAAQTSGAQKKVFIGRNRVAFKNYRNAIAVGFHESIVHGGRSEGVSLPGSLDFEEGLATRLQQIISGERRTPGVQYYLAIGLQAGADRGGEPRNYRETFEILWRREALLMEKAGKPVDIDRARAQAQRHVHRTRRGGAVDTRDAAYFVGAQKAAAWLNQIAKLHPAQRREQLAQVLTNRYDPTNPDHAAFMNRQH